MIDKPSENEQEYFVRKELERIRLLREEHQRKVAEVERAQLKEVHWMHCPKCGASMTTTTLEKVEVDLCPACGGMYLDAGELDKIMDERRRHDFHGVLGKLRKLWAE